MSQLMYLSRNFVEFGAFKPEEILDFNKRGILLASDYVRVEANHHWQRVEEWLAGSTPAADGAAVDGAAVEPPAPEKKTKTATSKKKSGAKKAA